MCNHDYDVINDSLRKALRHAEKCTYVVENSEEREAIEEVIQLAEGLLHHLVNLEFVKEDET